MKNTMPQKRLLASALAFSICFFLVGVGSNASALAADTEIILNTPSSECGLEMSGWKVVTPSGQDRPVIRNSSAADATLAIDFPQNVLKICKVIELGDQEIIVVSAGEFGTSVNIEGFVAVIWDYFQDKQIGKTYPVGDRPVENPTEEKWVSWSHDRESLFAVELDGDEFSKFEMSQQRRSLQVSGLTPKSDPAPQPVPTKYKTVDVTLKATVWPVGKTPEGIVFDGRFFWVAEAGQRTIARVDAASGNIIERTKVGRLPVDMSMASNGRVYTTVQTDQTIWAQNSAEKGRKFATLKDYPSAMVGNDETLWVLVEPGGNSSTAKVVRLNKRNADAIGSPILPYNASGLVKHKGNIWVGHAHGPQGGVLSKLDPETLGKRGSFNTVESLSKIGSNSHSLYAIGGDWDKNGMVAKYDTQTGKVAEFKGLPDEFSYALAATEEYVIVAGYHGRIWVVSAKDLTILRDIKLDLGKFQPSTILPIDDTLYITTHKGQGENGSVLVIDGWQP